VATVVLRYRQPSSDDGAARLAEQRWLNEEARLRPQFAIARRRCRWTHCNVSGGKFRATALARVCCIVTLGGMARVIYLCIERQRRFIAVKMAGGMSRQEALSESNRRFGG